MTYFYIHASRQELDVLDQFQRFSQRVDGNPGIRMYTNGLEESFKDPEFRKAILNEGRKQYAKGGRVGVEPLSAEELNEFRKYGRNGDDAVAVVGPYTLALLETYARGKGTINPHTNLPEFFSLGGLFQGIGNAFHTLTSPITGLIKQIPGIGPIASGLINTATGAIPGLINKFAPMAGSAIGGMFGGPTGAAMGGQLGSQLGGMASQAAMPMVNQFGQHLASQFQGGAPSPQGYDPMAMYRQHMSGGMSPGMAAANTLGGYGGAMAQQMAQQPGMHPLLSGALNAFGNYAQNMTQPQQQFGGQQQYGGQQYGGQQQYLPQGA